MKTNRKVAFAAVTVAIIGLASPSFASSGYTPSGFNWFANGASSAIQKANRAAARPALQKARVLKVGASWVCSPAGFGRTSRCYRG
jgi:hypothetical protein